MNKAGVSILVMLLVSCGGGRNGQDATGDSLDEDVLDTAGEGDVPSDVEKEDGLAGLWLEVGDVVDIDGTDGLFEVLLRAPSDGGDYVLILFSSYWDFIGSYEYTASLVDGSGGSGGSPSHTPPRSPEYARSPEPASGPPRSPEPVEGFTFDHVRDVPGLDWDRLVDWLDTQGAIPAWETYPPDAPPVLDEVRSFQIVDSSGTVQTIDAECQVVNSEIAIWFDITTMPVPTVSDLDEIARLYGDIVMPRERVFFGQESDYNEDCVVHVLFSPIVADHATAYFSPCDLIEDLSTFIGCDYGNHAEMLYVSPPELLEPYMATPMAMSETLAHETAHMVYFHRKFLLNAQPGASENIYLNEALAALSQDLTGMAGGNFFVTMGGLRNPSDFRAIDILHPGGGYSSTRDGTLRGMSYLFLRYLFDQNGGETVQMDGSFVDDGSIAWLNTYVDSVELGEENIVARMDGRELLDLVFDFLTCLAMSNRGPDSAPISDDPAFNYLPTQTDPLTDRTRGTDMFGTYRDFSLTGPTFSSFTLNDGIVRPTGVQYLAFSASDLSQVTLEVEDGAEPWVRIGRLE